MEKQENILGTEKIGKLIRKFSIPCIISLLVNSLYNMVDQIFIGWGVGYLGNGATQAEARSPFIGEAMKKSFSPLIANMAVMGLVALPGTLVGQILGGSSPNVAIKYQIMIIIINFTASMLSLVITIKLSSRKSFDKAGVLKPVFKELK